MLRLTFAQDVLSHSVFAGKILCRHGPIHDDDRRLGCVVRVGEISSADEARAQRFEVTYADSFIESFISLP
jgi:hypothetical protein